MVRTRKPRRQGPSLRDPGRGSFLVVAEWRSRGEEPEAEIPSVRECVFDEAVHASGIVRGGARTALRLFVGFLEGDPTDPSSLADKTRPEHAGVGLHLLEGPERLAGRPYVRQARRLFARCDVLRDKTRSTTTARRGGDAVDKARDAFYEPGGLPEDDLMCDVLLADLEMNALARARGRPGRDVGELWAGLDRVARAEGEDRSAALRRGKTGGKSSASRAGRIARLEGVGWKADVIDPVLLDEPQLVLAARAGTDQPDSHGSLVVL